MVVLTFKNTWFQSNKGLLSFATFCGQIVPSNQENRLHHLYSRLKIIAVMHFNLWFFNKKLSIF